MGHTTIICEVVELLQSVKIGSHKQHTDRCVGTTLPRFHLALTPLFLRQRCLVVLPAFAVPSAMSVLDWTRARTRSAPTSVRLRVQNSPPRLRKANLLAVRTKEEIISGVRHQLSLAHRARARGNSSTCGIQTLDEGGSCQEAPARGPLRIPD